MFLQERRQNLFWPPGCLTAKLDFMGYFSSQNSEHLDRILFHPRGCSELSVPVSCVKSFFSRGLCKQPVPFIVIPPHFPSFGHFLFLLLSFPFGLTKPSSVPHAIFSWTHQTPDYYCYSKMPLFLANLLRFIE